MQIIGVLTSLIPLALMILIVSVITKIARKASKNPKSQNNIYVSIDDFFGALSGEAKPGNYTYNSPDSDSENSIRGESPREKSYVSTRSVKSESAQKKEYDYKPQKKDYEYKSSKETYGMTLKERRKMRFVEDGYMHCPYCGAHISDRDDKCRACKKRLQA